MGKQADINVLLRFGIPAIIFSFLGAWLLIYLTELPVLFQYKFFGNSYSISLIKLIIAVLLIIFSISEIFPYFQNIKINKNRLIVGGILSGFLGGLSGIQGAIRSAFLLKSGLSKEAYIATGVVIASFVDISRLLVYTRMFQTFNLYDKLPSLLVAILAAITGTLIGKKLLKKITFRSIQIIVAVFLILFSILLGLGVI